LLSGTHLSLVAKKPAAHIHFSLQKQIFIHYRIADFRSCGHGERIKKPVKRTSFAHFRYCGFSMIRTPLSAHRTLAKTGLFLSKWPPFSLVRTYQHTKPWQESVLLCFKNGRHFHWLEVRNTKQVLNTKPCKGSVLLILKMAAIFIY
jgi:hypothetical protein